MEENNIVFTKTGMYHNGVKVKEYSKNRLLGFDKSEGIDKSYEIRGTQSNGIIYIDEANFY